MPDGQQETSSGPATAAASSRTPVRGTLLRPLDGQPWLELAGPRLIVAGYTGRDAGAVAEHIAELAAFGVPPPASAPCFFDLDPALLTTGPVVETASPVTSGEVEPVLISHAGRLYLGVGSDHTDRDLERRDIAAAKAACPKVLAAEVIPVRLDGLDWDAITIESRVDGADYQRGRLAALRTPADLLARLGEALGPADGDLVLFAGTVPLLEGQVISGTRWQITLTTAAGARLTHSYEVKRRNA